MSVPDFQTMMLPALQSLADGQPHTVREVTDAVAGALGVTIAMSVVLLCGTLVVCTDELTKSRA